MQSKIDTILFDLDDTLILEAKTARECITKTVTLTGLIPDTSGFFNTIHQQAREIWYKLPTIEYCLKIGISSLEALWADFTIKDLSETSKIINMSLVVRNIPDNKF